MPPSLLPLFDWTEKRSIYARGGIGGGRSIFDRLAERGAAHHVYTYHQHRDAEIFDQAGRDLAAGESGFYFLYLSEVDALLHHHFHDRQKVDEKLDWYAGELRRLFTAARTADPEATFTIFSDHGMAPVREHYPLVDQVEALGFHAPSQYLAIYDSTMARFWFFDEAARREIVALLESVPCGRVVPDAELQELGVWFPDRRYGELILLLHPGWLLAGSRFNASVDAGRDARLPPRRPRFRRRLPERPASARGGAGTGRRARVHVPCDLASAARGPGRSTCSTSRTRAPAAARRSTC